MKHYRLGCAFCTHTERSSSEAAVRRLVAKHEKTEHPFLAVEVEHALIGCSEPDCERGIRDHRWARIKAADEGWFFQKDGSTWCPDHNPPWVAGWRARKLERPNLSEVQHTSECDHDTGWCPPGGLTG